MDGAQAQPGQKRLSRMTFLSKAPALRGAFFVPAQMPILVHGKEPLMPLSRLLLILAAVILAAAVTVWLLTQGSPGLLIAALPAFMIAAVAVWALRR